MRLSLGLWLLTAVACGDESAAAPAQTGTLINLAIGGGWGGQKGIDDGRFPHWQLVDCVRIFQQK